VKENRTSKLRIKGAFDSTLYAVKKRGKAIGWDRDKPFRGHLRRRYLTTEEKSVFDVGKMPVLIGKDVRAYDNAK
jgi:hypothetical protein